MGCLDVATLAVLVTTAEQDHQGIAGLVKIHPVTGAIMNSEFTYTMANRGNVARQAFHQPVDTGNDPDWATSSSVRPDRACLPSKP